MGRFLVIGISLLTVPLCKLSTSESLDPPHCFLMVTITTFVIIKTPPGKANFAVNSW